MFGIQCWQKIVSEMRHNCTCQWGCSVASNLQYYGRISQFCLKVSRKSPKKLNLVYKLSQRWKRRAIAAVPSHGFQEDAASRRAGLDHMGKHSNSKVSLSVSLLLILSDRKPSCWWLSKQWFIMGMALTPQGVWGCSLYPHCGLKCNGVGCHACQGCISGHSGKKLVEAHELF